MKDFHIKMGENVGQLNRAGNCPYLLKIIRYIIYDKSVL